jgi:hypothetical protein
MSNIYLLQNYLINKLTKTELKLSNLDESYRTYCDSYHDSIKINIYSKMIENKKYAKLIKKINLLNIELELTQKIIKDLESMYEHRELMVTRMWEYKI